MKNNDKRAYLAGLLLLITENNQWYYRVVMLTMANNHVTSVSLQADEQILRLIFLSTHHLVYNYCAIIQSVTCRDRDAL